MRRTPEEERRRRFQRLRLSRPGRTWEVVEREPAWPPQPPVVDEVVTGSGLRMRYMVPSTPGARRRVRWHRRFTVACAVLGLAIYVVSALRA